MSLDAKPALDRDLLAKALSRLSSSHAGEAVAAALVAQSMLDAAGLSWQDVICRPAVLAPENAPFQPPAFLYSYRTGRAYLPVVGATWGATARYLMTQGWCRTDAESRAIVRVMMRDNAGALPDTDDVRIAVEIYERGAPGQ